MQNGRLGGDGTSSRRAVAGSAGARQVLPAQAVAVAAWAEVVEPDDDAGCGENAAR